MIKKALLFLLCIAAVSVSISTNASAQGAHDPADIERRVREAFADAPVMIEIARCESKFRQFADSGNPLRGGMDSQMIGIFQIFGNVHRSTALSLGFDIDTIEGNIGYARSLYLREGTTPWISSMPCWNVASPASAATTVTTSVSVVPGFAVPLTFGMTHPEVLALQKALNAVGYIIASSGPGSPGQETDYFGSLTRLAVRRFQCDKAIVCSGDEYTTSYGVVGPRTRAALSSLQPGAPPSVVQAPVNTVEEARVAGIRAQIEALRKQIAELEEQL